MGRKMMPPLWSKTVGYDFPTRFGVLHAKLTQTELLEKLNLARYEYALDDHRWVIETAPRNRPSFFDYVAWKHFSGTYLKFAQWVAEQGRSDEDFEGVYIARLEEGTVIIVDPLEEGLVELSFFFPRRRYFVSVTPHTPVGLLAKIALEVRRNEASAR